jgi:hypothetical protein
LQQTFPLLFPQPYKHPKTTKLNLNTPWMKQNYKKPINIDYYCFLPSMNHSKFMKIQYICQLFYSFCFTKLSIPIFNIPCHLQSSCIYNNGWIKSSFVNLHPSPCVMLHLKARFPHPKHWDPTLVIVTLKLIWPKLVLGMVDIVLQ